MGSVRLVVALGTLDDREGGFAPGHPPSQIDGTRSLSARWD